MEMKASFFSNHL